MSIDDNLVLSVTFLLKSDCFFVVNIFKGKY